MRGRVGLLLVAAFVSAYRNVAIVNGVQEPSNSLQVVATVTGEDGAPMRGLTPDIFQVWTDGRPTSMVAFAPPEQPFSAALVLGTGVAVRGGLRSVQDGAQTFVLGLGERDRVALCLYGSDVICDAAFGANRVELQNRVHDIDYRHGTRVFDAIDTAITRLREVTGRRVLVALTARVDLQSRVKPSLVLDHARENDVMVYVIGVNERFDDGDEFVDGQPDPDLQRLARETGGRYFEIDQWSDVQSSFSRIASELHNQYMLRIQPSVHDARIHSLQIRLNIPKLRVRARRTFQATGR